MGIVVLVIAAIEVNVKVGNGPGAVPLDLRAYLVGGLLAGGGFQVRATLPITTRSGGSASRVAGVPVARSESS